MPIFEFYCEACHRVFNFLARPQDRGRIPPCPQCQGQQMSKWLSPFAVVRSEGEGEEEGGMPPELNNPRAMREMMKLMSQAESMEQDDPRAMGAFLERAGELSGEPLPASFREAIARLKAGEDPEKLEEDMGDLMESIEADEGKGGRSAPTRDETLYDFPEES